jgi:UDP-2-acetamido-3-amino-2,3-dideoxy-glucuronate N-acetyltransferase
MNEVQAPRIGVAGCGYWGKNLVRNFAQLGSLATVCDVDPHRSAELGRLHSVRITTSFEELVNDSELQAVAIAAPAAEHYDLAKRALAAGKDVFVEKPLALHVEEGEELVDLSRRHGRVLMVGHLLQYHPAVLELRKILRAGELGRVEYISSSRLNLGRLRTEEDILWSFAPHDISAILYLLDETPARVAAQGANYLNREISDVTLTVLSFDSGVKAHIFVSWLHPYKEQKLVVVGNRKMAVFDDTQSERKLVLYPHKIEWINRVPVAHKAEGEVRALDKTEPLQLECEHFLQCIRDRKTPRTDGGSAVRVLKILRAASDSVRGHGQSISLASRPKPRFFAHSSAIVDEPCEIGDGTKVWHFSHIMAGCKIGSRCVLGQNVNVAPGVQIGDNVKIQNNVSLYTGVQLEDDVFCGPSMVFTNVINPRSHVNRKSEYRRTVVRRGASLGANSTIVCGVTIGRYSFVAAGAVVTRDVADYALVMGMPARQTGWVCQCGMRLDVKQSRALCVSCGTGYAMLDIGKLVVESDFAASSQAAAMARQSIEPLPRIEPGTRAAAVSAGND